MQSYRHVVPPPNRYDGISLRAYPTHRFLGVRVLIRLLRAAHEVIARRHDQVVIGATVALAMWTWLGRADGLPIPQRSDFGQPAETTSESTSPQHFAALPDDAAYYRQKWADEASAFYATRAGRPRDSRQHEHDDAAAGAPAAGVVPASATSPESENHHEQNPIRQATHLSVTAPTVPPSPPATTAPSDTLRVHSRSRIITGLAAGLLASLVFGMVWPCVAAPPSNLPPDAAGDGAGKSGERSSETRQIELPSAWVQVRPTVGSVLRSGIAACGYVAAVVMLCRIWLV